MEDKITEKYCELCEEKASNVCFDCSLYLCDSCFTFIHKKKEKTGHKKEEIDPFISFDIRCPFHPKIPMNLFCIEDKSKYIYIIFKYRTYMLIMLI